jgi:hypothetical protein
VYVLLETAADQYLIEMFVDRMTVVASAVVVATENETSWTLNDDAAQQRVKFTVEFRCWWRIWLVNID